MKKFTSTLVLIFLSFVTALAQQHPVTSAAPPEDWINIAPEKAGFSVLMPGRPTEKVDPVGDAPGVENHVFALETPAAGYVLSYVQFGQDVTDPDAIKGMLDAGREGGLASSGSKLKSEKEIKLNEFYGREWLLDLPGGPTATTRAYWVKRRLYQLVFVVAPSATDTADTLRLRQEWANKFFDSFRLISEGGH